ncbi:MAG: LLM class flavin-dependent oxidoreductase [Acidimicrobiales bacterium]
MPDVSFGVFVPQGWKMDLAGIPDPAAKWAHAVDTARRAERLGYDSVWVYDHVHYIPKPAHEAVFGCWTTMAAISQRTERVRLGQMVTCAAYRNPAYLAKVWIGGGGEQLTLRVVARHADVSNFGGKPHEWARKREILKEHCRAVGRDEETIRKTWSPEVLVRETEAELVAGGSRSVWGEPFESWREGNLVGTPDQVAEKIRRYVDLGCSGFVPWCADHPETETLELLAEKVIPEFR